MLNMKTFILLFLLINPILGVACAPYPESFHAPQRLSGAHVDPFAGWTPDGKGPGPILAQAILAVQTAPFVELGTGSVRSGLPLGMATSGRACRSIPADFGFRGGVREGCDSSHFCC